MNNREEKNPEVKEIDCIGLYCPEPLFQTRDMLEKFCSGDILEVLADDPAEEDLKRYCNRSGNSLIKFENIDGEFHFWIKKK